MPRKRLYLSGDPEADALLTKDPLALVIGMVLDHKSSHVSMAVESGIEGH